MPGPNRAPRGGYQKPKDLGKTISRLLGYLTRSKLPLMAVFGCLLISVFTNIGGSYMMRGIINDFIWSGCTDFAGLGRAILVLVGIYLIGCAATYGQSAVMVRLAQRGINRLRKDLFDKLQDLPLSYFDKHPHGELMRRFTSDADNVQLALEQSVVSMCSSCLMFVGLVAMMLFINWKLFLVTALVLALTMVLFNKLGGRSRRFYQKQQAALGDVNGDIQEIIEGLKVVKAFTHEEQAKDQFRKLNETYRDAAQKANFYSTMIMPVSGNLMNISYALTAAFGGLLSVIQGFDLGGLVVYLNYSKQVGQPLNQISQQMTTLLSALAGAERIFEVMDTQPEVDEGTVTLVGAEKDANGTLSAFTLVAISIPIMRKKRPDLPRAFKMPGSPWIPILIAVANFWLMLNLSVLTWIRFVVWLVVGFAIYFGYGYWHARLGKGDLTETLSAETDKAVNG